MAGSIFDFRVSSEIPLQYPSNCESNDTKEIIRVTEGEVKHPENKDRDIISRPGTLYFRQRGVGIFRIENDSVVIDRSSAATNQDVAATVLGRVRNILLYQRGYFLLHGSAVSIDDRGVAFIGFSGSGKSSIAAAMHTNGHRVATDDTIITDFEDGISTVPSFPRLKLPKATVDALDLADHILGDDEIWFHVEDGFERSMIPLTTVYVVEDDLGKQAPMIESMRSQSAMKRVLQHSVGRDLVEATGTEGRHFQECAKVVDGAVVKWLYRPDDFSQLPELVQVVEDDLN